MAKKSPTFSKLLKSDIQAAIAHAKAEKLKKREVDKGLSFAFENNHPDLWKAIVANHTPSIYTIDGIVEEASSEALYPEMIRLWLVHKPSQDMIDDCLFFVGDALDFGSTKGINSDEDAQEVIKMLIDAGAKDEDGTFLPYLVERKIMDYAEKIYAKKKLTDLLVTITDEKDAYGQWLLSKPIDWDGADGAAVLYAMMLCENKAAFEKYLPKVNFQLPFSSENLILVNEVLKQRDFYYLDQLLDYGAKCFDQPALLEALMEAIGEVSMIRELGEDDGKELDRVKMLLELGAKPSEYKKGLYFEDDHLTRAAVLGLTDVVGLLLEYGADPHTARNQAMHEAREQGDKKMEQLLLDAGAPPLSDDPNRPPLEMPKDTNDIVALWKTWLDFYQKYLSHEPKKPIKGASAERIAKMEACIGFEIPEDIKTIYSLSEGGEELFFGMHLFTPERVCEEWKEQQVDEKNLVESGYYDEGREYAPDNMRVYPPDSTIYTTVDEEGNYKDSPQMLLVDGHEGGCLFVDFSPGKTGTFGQIINIFWGHDGEYTKFCRLGANITELVAHLMQLISDGQFELSMGYGINFDLEADYNQETGEGSFERILFQWLRAKMYPESVEKTNLEEE